MKLLFTLPFLFITSLFAQNGTIKGFIHPSNDVHGDAFVYVIVLNTNYKTTSDLEGIFFLNNLPPGDYDIQLKYPGLRDTILTQIKVVANEVRNLDIEYPFCEYKKHDKYCPICLRKDEAIPIMYGFPTEEEYDLEKKGKLILGGSETTGCDPHWYCKRDKWRF